MDGLSGGAGEDSVAELGEEGAVLVGWEFCGEFLDDGVEGMGHLGGEVFPLFLQLGLGDLPSLGGLLPLLIVDSGEFVGAADFHGEAGLLDGDVPGIGEGGGEIVEGGEADLAFFGKEEAVVFGVGVGAADDPVEEEGVEEALHVLLGAVGEVADEGEDGFGGGAAFVFVFVGGRAGEGLAAVFLMDALHAAVEKDAVEALDDEDGSPADGFQGGGRGGEAEPGGETEAEVFVEVVAVEGADVGLEDVGGGGVAVGDAPAIVFGIVVEAGLGLGSGEAELALVPEASGFGVVGDQGVDALDEVGFAEPGDLGFGVGGWEGVEALRSEELDGSGAFLADVGEEAIGIAGRDLEAFAPGGEDLGVVGEESGDEGADDFVGMAGRGERHGEGEGEGGMVFPP